MKSMISDDYKINLNIEFDEKFGSVICDLDYNSNVSVTNANLSVFEFIGGEWVCLNKWCNKKEIHPLRMSGDFQCESGIAYKARVDAEFCIDGMPVPVLVTYDALCV